MKWRVTLFLAMIHCCVYGQANRVRVAVCAGQESLQYVYVLKNNKVVAVTDSLGRAVVGDPRYGDTISVSYVGYGTRTVRYENQSELLLSYPAGIDIVGVAVVGRSNVLARYRRSVVSQGAVLNYIANCTTSAQVSFVCIAPNKSERQIDGRVLYCRPWKRDMNNSTPIFNFQTTDDTTGLSRIIRQTFETTIKESEKAFDIFMVAKQDPEDWRIVFQKTVDGLNYFGISLDTKRLGWNSGLYNDANNGWIQASGGFRKDRSPQTIHAEFLSSDRRYKRTYEVSYVLGSKGSLGAFYHLKLQYINAEVNYPEGIVCRVSVHDLKIEMPTKDQDTYR